MTDKKSLENPFPGLRPFQSDEEHLFFGRENQTLELLQILRDNRFVGVIGTSGSGKSSLVRCGLLSELYGGAFLDAGTDWEVAVMNPGGGPFNQLSKALVNADIYDAEEDDIHLKLNATLRRSRLGLVEAIRQADLAEGTNFLLVVDQFEEIFRYSEAGEEEGEAADDFIAMILEAAKQTNVPIYVIITMRSDYIGDCSKFEGLPEEINDGEYLIPRLTREEYKSVIEGPIKVGGGKLAPRLLQRLLNDIGTEADQLPCLQHALMRTWDAWADREDAEELDLEDYRAIGGMSKALSIHADEIFATFKKDSTKETATRMFRAITEKGDDNRGIRRPLRLQQLADITNKSIDEVKRVIEPYRQPGVTFIMPPTSRELEPNTVIDISHESLMRVWQRLRNWVEEEAQSARVYRRLVDTSSLWKKGEAGLYHDPDLQIAQSWRDQYEPNKSWADLYGGGFETATEFLEASEEEGRREERAKELARQKELEQAQELADARARSAKNMKRFAAVVGFVAIIAVVATIFAFKAQKKAVMAQNTAIEAKENLRINFARSDDSLGHSFANQKNIAESIAYFARSLVAEPNNPTAIDTAFNLFAYTSPPGHLSRNLDFDSAEYRTSMSTNDGQIVITGAHTWSGGNSQEKNLRLWDSSLDSYKEVPNGNGYGVWYNSLDISPDEKQFVVGWANRDFSEIIDIETLEVIQTIPIKGVYCRYSKDGSKLLINQGWKKATNIWDIARNSSILEIDTKDFYPEWNHSETKIVFGAHSEKQSAVLDIASKELTTFDYEHPITTGASFNNDGSKILTHSHTEGNFFIWDINNKNLLATLNYQENFGDESQPISGSRNSDDNWQHPSALGTFTPDGSKVIIAAPNLTVQLWDAQSGELLQSKSITENVLEFNKIIFSTDGLRMFIPLRNGKCYVCTLPNDYSEIPDFKSSVPVTKGYAYLANSGHLKPLHLPQRGITSSLMVNDKNQIFVGTDSGSIKLFDMMSGDQIGTNINHPGEILSLDLSPDRKKIATASNAGTVKIWNLDDTDRPIFTIGNSSSSEKVEKLNVKFGPNSDVIWVHSSEIGRGTEVWDIVNNKQLLNYKARLDGPVSSSSEDGKITVTTRGSLLRVFSIDRETKISNFFLNTQSSINNLIISPDNKFITVATENKKVSFWPIIKNSTPTHELEFDSEVISLTHIKNTDLIAVGCSSGKIYIVNYLEGILTDHITIQGDGPCISLSSNNLNHIAAIYQTASGNYATVYNTKTGRPLTGKLSNGTNISNVSFTQDESKIICLPTSETILDIALGQHSNISSIWPVSISDGNKALKNFSKILTTLGGKKLNVDGIIVDDYSLSDIESNIENLDKNSKTYQFFKWILEFPGTRSDSPFRKDYSQNYLKNLTTQNNLSLLRESLRIQKNDPLTQARTAIFNLIEKGDNNSIIKISSIKDLQNARKLDPENTEIIYYLATAIAYNGDIEKSLGYVSDELQAKLSIDESLRIIECLKRLNVLDDLRLSLLNYTISKNKDIPLNQKLVVERFNFAVERSLYSEGVENWKTIIGWDSVSEDINIENLFNSFIQLVESEAIKLAEQGNFENAIELLKPVALASLVTSDDSISSSIANIIEWENQGNPPIKLVPANATWKYLDDGSDQGNEWTKKIFDDSQWNMGPGKFGYGGDGEATKLSYGPNRNDKVRTYYFRHKFSIDDLSKTPFVVADIVRDDGVIVYLNGKEVVRNNMPSGEVDYQSFSARTAWENKNNGIDLYELFVHRHTIDIKDLVVGENVLAAELHQCNRGSSDLGFQLELLGSQQTPYSYIKQITSNEGGSKLLEKATNHIPKQIRNQKRNALLFALTRLRNDDIKKMDQTEIELGLNILQKLDSKENLTNLTDITVDALETSPSSMNYSMRVEVLNLKLDQLKSQGASEEAIKKLQKIIVSPPRDSTIPSKLIDLSDHYNASLFHYSAFHGGGQNQDIRFLYDDYNQKENIPFDLRGVVRLRSGPIGNWESSNDHWGTRSIGKMYPIEVNNIKVDSKSEKIHFLMGSVFSTDMTEGKTAAKFIINYKDGSIEEFPIIAKEDLFDWWTPQRSPGMMEEKLGADKIGWIGLNHLGNARGFCKPYWKNPHPEKIISHIDFVSGLIDGAPFLLGITLE